MKETKPKFLDKLEPNQLAQEIDNSIEEINNNNNPEPVIEIIPSLSDEEIKEMILDEWENKTNTIEDMTDPNPLPPINPDETATGTSQELKPKNTVRYIDGGFTF